MSTKVKEAMFFFNLLMVFFVVSLLTLDPGFAETIGSCVVTKYDCFKRPDPRGKPTNISVGIFVYDLMQISDINQTCTIDFSLVLRWSDPRLAQISKDYQSTHANLNIENMWNPLVIVANAKDLSKKYRDVFEVSSSGMVTYFQRFQGTLFFEHSLCDFPFDRHFLPIEIASSIYGPQEVAFVRDEHTSGQGINPSIEDWEIGQQITRSGTTDYSSSFRMDLPVRRNSEIYIWRMIVPLYLIVYMCWTVFWINPSQTRTQIVKSIGGALTLILFQINIGKMVPNISCLTWMDYISIGTVLFLFLSLVGAVVTSLLADRGHVSTSLKITRWARYIFTTLGIIIAVFPFIVG